MPKPSTARPDAAVTSVNVPFLLFLYRAGSDLRPRGAQSFELTRKMSSQPSPSASMNAQPDPIVSGSHFLPALPALCVNLIPADAVTSLKVTCANAGHKNMQRQAEDSRIMGVGLTRDRESAGARCCLPDSASAVSP